MPAETFARKAKGDKTDRKGPQRSVSDAENMEALTGSPKRCSAREEGEGNVSVVTMMDAQSSITLLKKMLMQFM